MGSSPRECRAAGRDRFGHRRDRLVRDEAVDPAGHRVNRNECAARVRQEHHEEREPVRALGGLRDQADHGPGLVEVDRAVPDRHRDLVVCARVCEREVKAGPATRRSSSRAVRSVTTRPASSTAIRTASRSASSRYWLVRNTVSPPPTSSVITSHICWRLRGSSPVAGSSENSTTRPVTRVAARSSRRRIPPE